MASNKKVLSNNSSNIWDLVHYATRSNYPNKTNLIVPDPHAYSKLLNKAYANWIKWRESPNNWVDIHHSEEFMSKVMKGLRAG